MASLERRGKKFRLVFRYAGTKYQHPLRTEHQREAEACAERVEENIRLLERGRLLLPPDADLATFLLSDGRLNDRPVPRPRLTLAEFRERYMEAHSQGSLEAKTLQTLRTHFTHLVATFGERFNVQALVLPDLQGHVNRRAKEGRGIYNRPLSPARRGRTWPPSGRRGTGRSRRGCSSGRSRTRGCGTRRRPRSRRSARSTR